MDFCGGRHLNEVGYAAVREIAGRVSFVLGRRAEARWSSQMWRNRSLTTFCHSEGGRCWLAGEQNAMRDVAGAPGDGVHVVGGKKVVWA